MAKRLSQDIKNKASHAKKTKARVAKKYAAKAALASRQKRKSN